MREQLLATLKARLRQVAAAQDPALALEPGALDEAQSIVSILRDDDGDIEARLMLGWFYWYQYLALPESQDHKALQDAIQALTPCFLAGVENLPEPLLPVLADNAADTAIALLQQAMTTSDLTLITTTVSVWQRILTVTPRDHPDRAAMLSNLGGMLRIRFERAGAAADLDEAITVGRAAVATAPGDHPHRAMYLCTLGSALEARFEQAGRAADLDQAIESGRAAAATTPTGPGTWPAWDTRCVPGFSGRGHRRIWTRLSPHTSRPSRQYRQLRRLGFMQRRWQRRCAPRPIPEAQRTCWRGRCCCCQRQRLANCTVVTSNTRLASLPGWPVTRPP